jgi:single-strand DNA-binding protein
MKNLMNSVRLYGNVGKDPVVTQFENGNKVIKWSMATSERLKNGKGETIDDVQWHQLIAWGSLASVIEKYVKKGSKLAIEGKLNHRRYKTKNGEEREITEIVVKDVLLLEKKNGLTETQETEEMPF